MVITAAVGAIVLAGEASSWRVLLVCRGRAPLAMTWTLPGGRVEPGESFAEATRREVLEETGLVVRILEETEVFELVREGFAYAIHEHLCVPVQPEALLRPGDDAADVRWATAADFDALGVPSEARGVIARAARLLFGRTSS